MEKTVRTEGKTTTEAIEKGLKELGVSKDKVEIKVLEEEKRSFYSILSPRDVKVELTLKEYEVLCLLLKNSGTVLSRTQLLNQVWGYEFDGESRTVDVHIRTLRQKLGSAGELVETVRGVGYKINMK